MMEKSFAPADPSRPPAPRPGYPEESPAIVRRYMWPDMPAEPAAKPAPAAADRDAQSESLRP
jgi:hypothetical protein